MSLEKDFEAVRETFGIDPRSIIGHRIKGYRIDSYIGHGKIGVVFRAEKEDTGRQSACKIIPRQTLKPKWDDELKKLVALDNIEQVVQYQDHFSEILPGTQMNEPFVCIFYEYVKGSDLRKYAEKHPEAITLVFVENLAVQILQVFQALRTTKITHGDLHEGNIMVTDVDERLLDPSPRIKVTDFGIGGSNNRIQAQDDYFQLYIICSELIKKYIDPSLIGGEERFFCQHFMTEFLGKQLIESDPTVGEFVRNPRVLVENIKNIREQYKWLEKRGPLRLKKPFEYLSCEQIGDSFKLLHDLYSRKFPGYGDLTTRTNTVLTGPRGCGKTTIFRNLSLKAQLLSGAESSKGPYPYIGIYYHCNDLVFAFPYKLQNLEEPVQRLVTHYFNLAILFELLDTLVVAEENGLIIPSEPLKQLESFLKNWILHYETPPKGTPIMRHLQTIIGKEKQDFRRWIDTSGMKLPTRPLMSQDFLKNLCKLLRDNVPWMKEAPFYFFLDDYSMPKVSDKVQAILNSFIFVRYSELFFKVSTESLLTLNPCDASGKILDESRELGEIIELGQYFLHASAEEKLRFLTEVVNNRLGLAEEFKWIERDIVKILYSNPYQSYNALARNIRSGKHVTYCGWDTIVDLCSGDIADILRLVRDVFTLAELRSETSQILCDTQDKAMRVAGDKLLSKIAAVPDVGAELAKSAQAFGKIANHYLKTRDSKNEAGHPPLQAFRIEVRETPDFSADEKQVTFGKPLYDVARAKKHLEDLQKYGVFIRDVTGKSLRGEVTPRLYLRRLLIPTFVLTPNKRDSISLEKEEFILFLTDPMGFERHMLRKSPRRRARLEKSKRLETSWKKPS